MVVSRGGGRRDGFLVGRDAELAELERLLDTVSASGFRSLALTGEAGMGKTALWQEAQQRARDRGWIVLSARTSETELPLSYVTLSDLLAPFAETALPELPDPQRRALEIVLLKADSRGPPVILRAVAAGALAMLTRLAAVAPVLIAVDHAESLDRASAGVLEFVVRRLQDEPIALLFCVRGDDGRTELEQASGGSLTRIEVGPLPLAQLHALIKARFGKPLPRRLLNDVERFSGGNPFFALELAHSLLNGSTVPGDEVPELPATLGEGVRARIAALPLSTREALLLAATASLPTVDLVDQGQLAPAEEAGLVAIGHNGAIVFASPLIAWAARDSSSVKQRRSAHARLADLVDDSVERAGHRALAAEQPSGELAAELEQTAWLSRTRGAPAAASGLMSHAMRLTPDEDAESWSRRCAAAISLLTEAGDWEQSWSLAEAALTKLPPGRMRAAVLIEAAHARPTSADLLRQVLAEAGDDSSLTTRAALMLTEQAMFAFDVPAALDHAEAAIEGARRLEDSALLCVGLGYRGIVKMVGGGGDPSADFSEATAVLERLPLPPMPIGYEPATWAAAALAFTDHFADAGVTLEAQRQRSEEAGDETSQSMVLAFLHQADLVRGNWALARSRIDEAVRLTDLMEHPTGRALNRHWLARLQVRQGEIEGARTTIAEGLELAEATGDRLSEAGHLAVLCFLALTLDDPAGALDFARRARGLLPPGWHPPPWLLFEGDELEAMVAVGRSADVERQIASLLRRGRGEQRPRLEVWALRGQALHLASKGQVTEALTALDRALAAHETLQSPFELARTLLVKGKVERRARHKAAARAALEQALDLFDALGAPIWSQKARDEHARLGIRRSNDELSPTEQKVADLAAAGKKNREIAAELFITRRTVEANLARAYRKLGVQSRAELGARMATSEASPDAPGADES